MVNKTFGPALWGRVITFHHEPIQKRDFSGGSYYDDGKTSGWYTKTGERTLEVNNNGVQRVERTQLHNETSGKSGEKLSAAKTIEFPFWRNVTDGPEGQLADYRDKITVERVRESVQRFIDNELTRPTPIRDAPQTRHVVAGVTTP
jgi:hypothetical protein